jgi:ABC-type multidrug transport system ATPase subunit
MPRKGIKMDIEIRDLCKSFDNKLILNHISAIIKDKQTTCITGQSGCGKTTFIHILMGITKADSGAVLGIDQKNISAVFQEDRLSENITILKNIRLVCDKTISDEEIIKHVTEVGLMDYLEEPIHKLSGGMRRRVAIVRAIIVKSNAVIMDEPFKGLDDTTKSTIIAYIKKYISNRTLVVVTHDKREIDELEAQYILNI